MKFRVLKQMYDSSANRLRSPGEEVDLDLTPEDKKKAIDSGILQPIDKSLKK